MLALRIRHITPAVVATLSRRRDRARTPELATSLGIVRHDHAGFGICSRERLATASTEHLAIRHDRTGGLMNTGLVVEDLRVPHLRAGARIERVQIAVC